jgi:hypothetical protein
MKSMLLPGVVVIGLDRGGQIDNFTPGQLPGSLKDNWLAFVIDPCIVAGQAEAVDKFAALGNVFGWDFIFREDGIIRTFGNASATVNAGTGINIKGRPLAGGVAGADTLNRANFHTPIIAQTETGNNMRHSGFSLIVNC